MNALLERYEAIDGATISAWIAGRQQEGLHLEFKTIGNGSNVTRDDRKNFAIVLSGFANADGGIVVWGVAASRDQDGVDAASTLAPIMNPDACLSTLQCSHCAGNESDR